MSKFLIGFVKATGALPQAFYFKKKVYFEDNDKSLKNIKGGALIVSNHKSVFDYALTMFTFWKRDIHCLVGENIYTKKRRSFLMKHLGNIKVDRQAKDFSFVDKTINLLKKGKLCLVYPEARLHKEGEDPNQMLEFTPSFAYIALQAGVPIIPIYTNGIYGKLKKQLKSRAKIIIGKPIHPAELIDPTKSDKENILVVSNYVKQYIEKLGKELERK